eukprot:SAG31_NODE_5574_length_2448_cov_3.162197_4_plen_237_part_00
MAGDLRGSRITLRTAAAALLLLVLLGGAHNAAAGASDEEKAASPPAAGVLRTPEASFSTSIAIWPTPPRYHLARSGKLPAPLRLAYYVSGQAGAAQVAVLIHGNPDWCMLYHTTVPPLNAGGVQTICLDLPGFGRSDKLVARESLSYDLLCDVAILWFGEVVLPLARGRPVTVVGQDWGAGVAYYVVGALASHVHGLVVMNGPMSFQEVNESTCPPPTNMCACDYGMSFVHRATYS